MSLRNTIIWGCVSLAVLGTQVGCTNKRERVEQRQQASGTPPVAVPPDSSSRGSTVAPDHAVVDTASSVAEIFSRIHEHESNLSQIIATGRLHELGTDASGIRTLLATAARLAPVPQGQRSEFEAHVSEARKAAMALVEAGKAGSLEESKARNADLQRELGMVERMVAQPRI